MKNNTRKSLERLYEKRGTVKRHRKRSCVLKPDISTKPASSSVKNVLSPLFSAPLHLTSILRGVAFLCAIMHVWVCLEIPSFEGLKRNFVVSRHVLQGRSEIISFSLGTLVFLADSTESEESISVQCLVLDGAFGDETLQREREAYLLFSFLFSLFSFMSF